VLAKGRKTFAAEVMVEFADREAFDAQRKRIELASAIEAALGRKPRLLPLEEAAIPVVEALGRQGASPLQNDLGPRRRNPDRDRRAAARTPWFGRCRGSARRRGNGGVEIARRPPGVSLFTSTTAVEPNKRGSRPAASMGRIS
jgi:hypothetical protein